MELFKNLAVEFIKSSKENQVVIVLLFLISLLTYDRIENQKKIVSLETDRRIADSSNVSRFNATVANFQKKIEDCNNQRIKEFIQQNEAFQKKWEEMFQKTDQQYFEIQKLKSQQQ